MMPTILRLFVLVFMLGTSACAWSRDLAGKWDLRVENKNHQVMATLVIEFSHRKAESCLAGDWLSIKVISSSTKDAKFFPVSDAWSYRVEKNQLKMGRNEICDAYLMMEGPVKDEVIRGEYFGFGWESTPLGFFVLSKKK